MCEWTDPILIDCLASLCFNTGHYCCMHIIVQMEKNGGIYHVIPYSKDLYHLLTECHKICRWFTWMSQALFHLVPYMSRSDDRVSQGDCRFYKVAEVTCWLTLSRWNSTSTSCGSNGNRTGWTIFWYQPTLLIWCKWNPAIGNIVRNPSVSIQLIY